jgi:hypothetical protein
VPGVLDAATPIRICIVIIIIRVSRKSRAFLRLRARGEAQHAIARLALCGDENGAIGPGMTRMEAVAAPRASGTGTAQSALARM